MNENERDGTLGEVIDQRVQVYGNPVETFARIAEVWSGILGVTVNATDVPLCLIGMKMVRTTQAPDYSDNSDDIEGYLDIFRQLVGPDMIQARSVTEYIEKKFGRPEPTIEVCTCHGVPLGFCGKVHSEDPDRTEDLEGEPIPYVLSEDERAQHLRRAPVVLDGAWAEVISQVADWSDDEFETVFGIARPEKP